MKSDGGSLKAQMESRPAGGNPEGVNQYTGGSGKAKGMNRRPILQSKGTTDEERRDDPAYAHQHEIERFNVEATNFGHATAGDSIGSKTEHDWNDGPPPPKRYR